MKRPPKPKGVAAPRSITVSIARADRLALWGAAYLMTETAHAIVGRKGGLAQVTLWPKSGSAAGLKEAFYRLYRDQRSRWAVERGGRGVRAEIVRAALERAEQAGAAPAAQAPRLSREQAAEIARMLAEAEAAPRDPQDISRPWEEGRP